MIIAAAIALALSAMPQVAPAPAPAPAPAAAPAPTAAPAAPAAPAEELICRRQPIEGSRRSERVCHTREQWAQLRANAGNNRDRLSQDQRN